MEDVVMGTAGDWYRDRTVLVTGHTGFKGAWLARWLGMHGARVVGYALAPEAGRPNLFAESGWRNGITSVLDDVRDARAVAAVINRHEPTVIFHLAAQALVSRSYTDPLETYATNVLGTANVLEAARHCPAVRAVVVVTSDKCYEPQVPARAHREDDPMGGHDPYSSSKGCAELVTAAYRRAFFGNDGAALVATARAGNVLGGGDWADDRLIPDLVRAVEARAPLRLRRPRAVRPWQHVLDPLAGYLMLGRRLAEGDAEAAAPWNFGPRASDAVTVRGVVDRVRAAWPGITLTVEEVPATMPETEWLGLDASKAERVLGWEPRLDLDATVEWTAAWYRAYLARPDSAGAMVERQIAEYERRASASTPVVSAGREGVR